MIIKMASLLYMYAGCSLRSIPKALEVVGMYFPNIGQTPHFSTVITWIEKLGLATLHNPKKKLKDYCMIVDGSIVVGGQQMMVALGVPANAAANETAISYSDVEVMRMELNEQWKSENVKEFIQETVINNGDESPIYALSDQGGNIKNAFSALSIIRHNDISHCFASYMKSIYESNNEFQTFENHLSSTRKLTLSEVGKYMPPKARTKARWMNIFIGVDWAKRMLDCSMKWTKKMHYFFGFIQRDAAIIEELSEVKIIVDYILMTIKTKGLSSETISEAKDKAKALLLISDNTRKLYKYIIKYLNDEAKLLSIEHPVHHASSDSIESLFGFTKHKTKCSRHTGFTSLSLVMPLKTRMGEIESCRGFDVVYCLATTSLPKVEQWKKEMFSSSYVMNRRTVLSYEKVI